MRETAPSTIAPLDPSPTGAQLLHRRHLIPSASNSRKYKTRSSVANGGTTAEVPSTSTSATANGCGIFSDEEDFCSGSNSGGSRDGDGERVKKRRQTSTAEKQIVSAGKVRLLCVALFHHYMESNLSRIYFVKIKGVFLRIVPHIKTQSSLPSQKWTVEQEQ